MVRVNRVRRIIRKIDPWTVLKVTLVLNFVVALTVVLGLSIMWVLLVNAGVPQGLEDIARRLALLDHCLLYTSPSPRDSGQSRMPSSA